MNDERDLTTCCQHECDKDAVVTMVWTDKRGYCVPHAVKALNLAVFMGYRVPGQTVEVVPGADLSGAMDTLLVLMMQGGEG